MASERYRRLLADLRYGSVIPWTSSQAQIDHIIRRAAEMLWPHLVPKVGGVR